MDGASALAALASAAAEADAKSGKTSENKTDSKTKSSINGADKENKRDANWFDVGIIKGSSCTVSSYYLPSGMNLKSFKRHMGSFTIYVDRR